MSFKFSKKINKDWTTGKNSKFDPGLQHYGNESDDVIRLEANPPCYFDLGKRARDLFTSGYHFGLLSLNIITKSPNNVKFTTTCVENISQGSLFGSLVAKYEIPDSFVLTEKWNTDCTVTTELHCKNKPVKGAGITFSGTISPRNGDKMGSVTVKWASKMCSLYSHLELRNKWSLLTTSGVLGYRGLLGGVMTKIDTYTARIIDLNFAAGFSTNDFILHTSFNNGSDCCGSVYHKVTPKVEAGVDVLYSTSKNSDILFGVAGKYQIDDEVCLRGKINNSSQLGLGCEIKLRESVTLALSALFDVRKFTEGKHKLGLSIQFES